MRNQVFTDCRQFHIGNGKQLRKMKNHPLMRMVSLSATAAFKSIAGLFIFFIGAVRVPDFNFDFGITTIDAKGFDDL